jgi:uncharacterized lipoprotein
MKSHFFRQALLLAGASSLLGGCSVVSGWFPDKQKQYKYSSEIPPLEIPPDLTSSTIDGASSGRGTEVTGAEETPPTAAAASATAAAGASGYTPAPPEGQSPAAGTPTLAQNTDNVPLIEIEAPFDTAWVEVSKALGRMELEISDQNRNDGLFYVYYGGTAGQKPQEDKGFFGDMAELFKGGPDKAQEYRVKLESRPKNTVVYVLDAENKPQIEGNGLELLKRLNETLSSMSKPAS